MAANERWQPAVLWTLLGDEIYSNGKPNLVVVGNDSLCIYALMRQPACDGESWGCVPLDAPDCPQFASDAGYRLAAGAQLAAIPVHQLDRDHLLRPRWGQVWRLEQQAYAALTACEDREHKYEQSRTPQRSAHHLIAWEWLTTEAEALIARYNAFDALARQVDAQFALSNLITGALRAPVVALQPCAAR